MERGGGIEGFTTLGEKKNSIKRKLSRFVAWRGNGKKVLSLLGLLQRRKNVPKEEANLNRQNLKRPKAETKVAQEGRGKRKPTIKAVDKGRWGT